MKWFERLLVVRRDRELSQRELAKLSSTNHVQISRMEKGEQMPKADTLYRICRSLNVSMDYIFDGFENYDTKIPPKNS